MIVTKATLMTRKRLMRKSCGRASERVGLGISEKAGAARREEEEEETDNRKWNASEYEPSGIHV